LASLKFNLPKPQELLLIFLICIFPTHVWSIIGFLRELPSFLLRLNTWQIVSIFSYAQVIVLFDTLLLTIVATIPAMLLPRAWVRNRFIYQAMLVALLISLWVVILHYQNYFLGKLPINEKQFPFVWGISLISVLVALSILLHRSTKFEIIFSKLIDNIKILSGIYLFIDLGCLIVLLIRFIGIVIL